MVDLNAKPARNIAWALAFQPSVFFTANSKLTSILALWCFGIEKPLILMHLTIEPSGGWPLAYVAAEQSPPGALVAYET